MRMATQSAQKRAQDETVIPDRLYFKIGDVARICGVETYVLRFWETQFPQLKPNKSGTGQRLYRKREVELALEIKKLVHDEGYTLAGARQALAQTHRVGRPRKRPAGEAPVEDNPEAVAAVVGHARAELREIAGMLAAPEPQPQKRRPRATALRELSGSLFSS
ncbi:MAG: MerR family transcriptional regulator [Acidobacteriota bacterium]|nr:MerR family transcriptional regulator [Acidobacteriota bacterium]MDE3162960.1 MerR family transcriptional regulator [Acidobacteriota bacterium]